MLEKQPRWEVEGGLGRLRKNAWVDPLVLRDAMLCIAPQHEGIKGINLLALILRSLREQASRRTGAVHGVFSRLLELRWIIKGAMTWLGQHPNIVRFASEWKSPVTCPPRSEPTGLFGARSPRSRAISSFLRHFVLAFFAALIRVGFGPQSDGDMDSRLRKCEKFAQKL
jgi:hypothetical protein